MKKKITFVVGFAFLIIFYLLVSACLISLAIDYPLFRFIIGILTSAFIAIKCLKYSGSI